MDLKSQLIAAVSFFYGLLHLTCGQEGAPQCLGQLEACNAPFTRTMAQGFGTIGPIMELCGSEQQIFDCLDAVKGDGNCEAMANNIRTTIKNLLVDSKVCDKKDEAQKYSDCYSNPAIVTGCQPSGGAQSPTCDMMMEQVNCFTKNTKDECGQPQSDLMRYVAKAMSYVASKALNLDCPELKNTSGVDKFVPMSAVFLGLLSAFMGMLILN